MLAGSVLPELKGNPVTMRKPCEDTKRTGLCFFRAEAANNDAGMYVVQDSAIFSDKQTFPSARRRDFREVADDALSLRE